MQRTALRRSCYEYHREEAWLFPDAEHGARQHSGPCGELRRRRRTVRLSAPQSELPPGLGDSVAPLRKTVFLHETSKRHAPFSAHLSPAAGCWEIKAGVYRRNLVALTSIWLIPLGVDWNDRGGEDEDVICNAVRLIG